MKVNDEEEDQVYLTESGRLGALDVRMKTRMPVPERVLDLAQSTRGAIHSIR